MLSDYEREQLAQIEQKLYEDKGFSRRATSATPAAQRARPVLVMLFSAIIGITLLVVGVALNLAFVGVLGFVVMLVGGVVGLKSHSIGMFNSGSSWF